MNRTNSAVLLRWRPANSSAFNEFEKQVLIQKLNLTEDGDLLIRSEDFRSQDQNKTACLQKLSMVLEKAFYVPKRRIKTKPTMASKRRRIEGKARTSQIKQGRKKLGFNGNED